jgi:hypothetical protein
MVAVVYRPQPDQDLGCRRIKVGGIPMSLCCDLTSKPFSTLRTLRSNRASVGITDKRVIVIQRGRFELNSWTDC